MNGFQAAGSQLAVLGTIAVVLALAGVGGGWAAARPQAVRSVGRVIVTWPPLVRLTVRYRRQIDFLVRRLRPGGAYGLTLTLGLSLLVVAVFAFGGLLDNVVAREEVALLDGPVARAVAVRRVGWLTAVMRAVTWLGSGWAITALVVGAGLGWWLRTRRWRPLVLLTVTASGAALLDLAAKVAVGRARPPADLMAVPAAGYAFPSGHTAQTAVYGALAFLLARTVSGRRSRIAVCAGSVAAAALIGLSRVYLGVHWLTDVLGGWALAVAWLAVVLTVSTTVGPRPAAAGPAAPPSPARLTVPGDPYRTLRTPPLQGLTRGEVAQRVTAGQVNTTRQTTSRSVRQIVAANVLTRFNALLGALACVMLWLGPPQDALFGLVIVANTGIGIIQEVRAKHVLDRLVLVTAPHARVVRDGSPVELPTDMLVLDDVIEVCAGDQVPVDALLLTADGLEIDESLLTGESDPVIRRPGEHLLAGSVVVAGVGRIQAVRVGADTYASKLETQARRYRPTTSTLRAGTDRILRYVTWALVPAAGMLITAQLSQRGTGFADALRGAVAGLVGMVPEGLVLLTSLAMAAAIIRLGRANVLVQELAAVEALARVDVLCLDKTGTLTDGRLILDRLLPAAAMTGGGVPDGATEPAVALAALAAGDPQPTASLRAVADVAPDPGWTRLSVVAFTSARKWSGMSFAGQGSVLLGAPEVLLGGVPGAAPVLAEARRQAATGRRVLALAHSPSLLAETAPGLPADRRPMALVLLREQIRPDAAQTLRYFTDQGVAVKVISGDSRETVAAVARAVGVPDADRAVDASDLPDHADALADAMARYSVFGRVGPHQKRAMVAALQARGHTVAMTGDGVNDVLALKGADLGIGLGAGTPAARAVAQLVLLDSRFAALPGVVAEGRRVIANIDRTAKLFVTKTVYVLLLALAVGVAGVAFPFLPRHLTLIGALTIGVPGFFLALAPNTRRARPNFVAGLLAFAVPCGAIAAAATLTSYGLTRALGTTPGPARAAAVFTLTVAGLSVLHLLIGSSKGWQRLLPGAMLAALVCAVAVAPLRHFFALDPPSLPIWAVLGILTMLSHLLFRLTARLADYR